MGYDEVHCAFTSFSLGHITMTCPYGKMGTIMKKGVGINPYTAKDRGSCLEHKPSKAEINDYDDKSLHISEKEKSNNAMCT
jgi:hypothetical protein